MRKSVVKFVILLIITCNISAQNEKQLTGFYSGNFGKNLAITLSLRQTGNEISGYYHYDKNNIDIRLKGKRNSAGNIILEEFSFFETTGYWQGNLIGDQYSGVWISGDKKQTLPFACSRINLKGTPGEPMSSEVTFGEKVVNLVNSEVKVPRDIAKKLFKEMVESDSDNVITSEVKAKGKKDPTVFFAAENIDLNHDQVSELIVSPSDSTGLCTTPNCPVWIFKKNQNGYQQILSNSAGIYGYEILDIISNNFNDIALIEHSSAAEHEYSVYRFNGSEYKLINCITETAQEGKNNKVSYTYKEHNCNK